MITEKRRKKRRNTQFYSHLCCPSFSSVSSSVSPFNITFIVFCVVLIFCVVKVFVLLVVVVVVADDDATKVATLLVVEIVEIVVIIVVSFE